MSEIKIFIDGSNVATFQRQNIEEYNDVTIYGSNSRNKSANVKIQNYEFKNV